MRRRHPSAFDLAAFFDGEEAPGVFPHAAGCGRCRAELADLQRVRAAVRGEAVPVPAAPAPPRRRSLVLVPVAAALALVLGSLALSAPQPSLTRVAGRADAPPALPPDLAADPAAAAAPAATGSESGPTAPPETAPPSTSPGPVAGGRSVTASGGAVGAAASARPPAPAGASAAAQSPSGPAGPPAAGPFPAHPTPGAAAGPLRFGVPVPAAGPLARQGEEALRAVRAVADAANRDGGVRGRTIEVVAVRPGGTDGTGLPEVDVFVGGFGFAGHRPAGIDWILPADPRPAGQGVAAGEIGADEAGAFLGTRLRERGVRGAVGVVVGEGPDAALADGLARTVPVERVAARDVASCDREVAALHRMRVEALAVAGPPELAQRCADAAARIAWRPYGGLLVPPSVAYTSFEREFSSQDAQTVVGFPVPGSSEPGAQRFRRAVRGGASYRAMISFAAAELALAVVRETGAVSAGAVTAGRWRSDLYHFDAGRNAGPRPVSARWGRWTPS